MPTFTTLTRPLRSSVACLLLLTLCLGSAVASSIWGCVDQVSVGSYRNYLDNVLQTQTGDNRGNGADHDTVREAVQAYLSSFGLTTSLDTGTYAGTAYSNVVGVQVGTTRPNDVYIIGAHYDSVNNPGADDNASGVAGLLEAARILSQYPSDATLIFIAFDREEQGMLGSYGYVTNHPGQNVQGMLSLDMIAYNPAGAHHDLAYVYGRSASDPWRSLIAAAVGLYGGVTTTIGGDLPYSDHAPFEAAGYDAALLIEHAWSENPNYHRATDTVDTLNYIDYDYASSLTRGAVGLFADQAGVQAPEPGTLVLSGIALAGLVGRVHVTRRRRERDLAA